MVYLKNLSSATTATTIEVQVKHAIIDVKGSISAGTIDCKACCMHVNLVSFSVLRKHLQHFKGVTQLHAFTVTQAHGILS